MNQSLRAIYADGVFRPLEAVGLQEHQEVILVFKTLESDNDRSRGSPIWEFASELGQEIPDDEWHRVPVDGATQLDHYLYGANKR